MKFIIVALCLFAVISTQKADGKKTGKDGGRPPLPPGCENAPNGTKISDCCPNFPKFFSREAHQNCSKACNTDHKKDLCCKTDCALNAVGALTNGKFDATKAKAAIATTNANNSALTSAIITEVVDACVANASAKLSEWRSKAPAGMGPNCTETTSLNMVIGQCIRRELFFQCPGLLTTDSCNALVAFGKACPIFPFHGGCHGKDDKEHGGKEKKDGSKKSASTKKP